MGGPGSGPKKGQGKNAWGTRTNPAPMAQDAVGPKNRSVIAFSMAIRDLPPIDRADAGQMRERIGTFFRMCEEWNMRPTVEGMCLSIGINRQIMYSMLRDDKPYKGLTYSSLAELQNGYDFLQQTWSQNFVEDGGNPVKYIFLGKNNFGYKDVSERIERRVDERPALPTPEEAAARFAGRIGVEIEVEGTSEPVPELPGE